MALKAWQRFVKKKRKTIKEKVGFFGGKWFMKKRKKTREEAKKKGTMGQPLTDDYGVPINPDYPKKTKVKINKINTHKYDRIARKKFNKDFDDLNFFQKIAVRKRAKKMIRMRRKKRGRR